MREQIAPATQPQRSSLELKVIGRLQVLKTDSQRMGPKASLPGPLTKPYTVINYDLVPAQGNIKWNKQKFGGLH